ncbi:Hypothetical predicted protein [Olea europaea subsp. europaea]|uniref:Uncharacterized protein n=1 Tax=Olea europaea subsp. europaea TaxID=158383 RepID=A0A8S0TDP5_OLEEU|nr:Hypothetical predicted protein [Olea europaea subsp. europaea]
MRDGSTCGHNSFQFFFPNFIFILCLFFHPRFKHFNPNKSFFCNFQSLLFILQLINLSSPISNLLSLSSIFQSGNCVFLEK